MTARLSADAPLPSERSNEGAGEGWAARPESALRLRHERTAYWFSVLGNLLIFLLAMYLINYKSDWLKEHERLAKRVEELRVFAFAMLLAPPVLVFLRNRRRAAIDGNSLRLAGAQFPELHRALEQFCDRLHVPDVPALYLTEDGIDEASVAYATWRGQFIVIRSKYLEVPVEKVRDLYEFAIGRELGRIRLGHTRWWDELLVVYILKIPLLRNPLLHARTYEQDRYGAYLAPGSIRGLVMLASGRHVIHGVDVPAFVQQSRVAMGFWPWLANLTRRQPHVTYRVRALLDAGLYDPASTERPT